MENYRIKLPELDERTLASLPVTVLHEPDPLPGDYVDTLAEWGNLPEVLPLPDVASFVAHRCGQNPQAIRKVLEDAVLNAEIRFWGLASNGEWKPFLLRMLHRFDEKDRRDSEDGKGMTLSVAIERGGRLHSEAMGVNAVDLVQLIKRRGRKIPPPLLALLPDEDPVPSVAPVQRSAAQDQTILKAIIAMGADPMAIPKASPGKPGVRAQVRKSVRMTSSVFEKAWQRLRDTGQIADAS